MRLNPLPSSEPFSRLAFVWLIYLASPLSFLVSSPVSGRVPVTPTLIAIVVFLPLYFWGYWLRGPRIVVPIAAMTILGIWATQWNPGASVFFLYAGTFASREGRPLAGAIILAAIVTMITTEWRLGFLSTTSWAWTSAATAMFGGLAIYFAEAGRKLQVAQDEARWMAVVAERERISRDLHDLLGHTLSLIALKSDLAARLAHVDLARSLSELADVQRISREALVQVREAVEPVRVPSFDREWRGAQMALEAAGVTARSSIEPVQLGPAEERVLCWVIREAATNIVRHAEARHCAVHLTRCGEHVLLDIQDDGRGGKIQYGSGLRGMRARVAECGGQLECDSSQGTHLTVSLPLSSPSTTSPREMPA